MYVFCNSNFHTWIFLEMKWGGLILAELTKLKPSPIFCVIWYIVCCVRPLVLVCGVWSPPPGCVLVVVVGGCVCVCVCCIVSKFLCWFWHAIYRCVCIHTSCLTKLYALERIWVWKLHFWNILMPSVSFEELYYHLMCSTFRPISVKIHSWAFWKIANFGPENIYKLSTPDRPLHM